MIAKKDLKISFLHGEVAKAAKENLDLKNQLEEANRRAVKAKHKVEESKNLSKEGYQTRQKTEEEQFAEKYQKAKKTN